LGVFLGRCHICNKTGSVERLDVSRRSWGFIVSLLNSDSFKHAKWTQTTNQDLPSHIFCIYHGRLRYLDALGLHTMAWFALSFRAPWASHRADSPPQQQRPVQDGTQHERVHTSTQAIESYTVRILDPSSRPSLHTKLRQAVEESGGVVSVDLVEGRGFM
jgi:hypothetical protein